ncbi:hypothetical protein FQR65_LT02139 [Abscondita terminalis]|nr:hypothetical protein FQR65_LT02139 [Abscondita terminalis]
MSNALNLENEPEKVAIIKPINSDTVHRICSGQVVLSLAIAVKELVENAIDANASSIEVRLKEYGSELIEVCDNGIGVKEENFQALTLKHYTSKLRQFSDLESVSTLGFRGEALSSLCALSTLTVTTRHSSAEHGTKISYNSSGKIISMIPAPREVGTTVTLESLFASLPVRRKEFAKNVKKEYSKMCQLFYAYCLVSKGIKFTCTNQNKIGPRNTVISTEGVNTVRENIISVFGTKQVQSLVQVDMIEPDEEILTDYKLRLLPGEPLQFNFEFIISSAIHGNGRSTTDRQFFYINDRPCESHKITKLVNEIYKQFNSNQYPFVFLNVIMERSSVDVNVTPDKRQIFLNQEKLLLATLKTSLLNTFKLCPSSYVPNVCIDVGELKRKDAESFDELKEQSTKCSGNDISVDVSELVTKSSVEDMCVKVSELKENMKQSDVDAGELNETGTKDSVDDECVVDVSELTGKRAKRSVDDIRLNISTKRSIDEVYCKLTRKSAEEKLFDSFRKTSKPNKESVLVQPTLTNNDNFKITFEEPPAQENLPKKLKLEQESSSNNSIEEIPNIENTSKTDAIDKKKEDSQKTETSNTMKVRFRSEITPSSNKSAEEELQKQLTKDMFKKMQIIGQFNLGFIITKLEGDLFIVDQHATDEKYNFEQLQLHTVIENQVLVNPRPLELSHANEELLIENVDVFRKNGFKFIIDPNAPATKKIKLASIPISKNYIFGKDDIEEMLFMMQEEINLTVCRPTRIRSMFASRACRKSVMVGCPLNHNEMKQLIEHMGEIDQPWNCPHGRPTIRHLINLNLLQN